MGCQEFEMEQLSLVETVPDLLEIDIIGSDCACFLKIVAIGCDLACLVEIEAIPSEPAFFA